LRKTGTTFSPHARNGHELSRVDIAGIGSILHDHDKNGLRLRAISGRKTSQGGKPHMLKGALAASDRGVAEFINMALEKARLMKFVQGQKLLYFAREIEATTWSQFFITWVMAEPRVTCGLTATSNPAHAAENVGALRGPLSDTAMRRRMVQHRPASKAHNGRPPASTLSILGSAASTMYAGNAMHVHLLSEWMLSLPPTSG
jgi:hypothetical protein